MIGTLACPLIAMQTSTQLAFKRLFGASLVAACLGSMPVAFGQTSTPEEIAEYARPHQLIDVGQGRKLNLVCRGTGSATVIFEAGMGASAWDWFTVHPVVARVAKACVYDRAGLGFSNPATRPGTSANAVDDLHTLLARANLKPPFILVGHSLGGRVAQLYAYNYPRGVSGIVIIDSDHDDETARGNRVTDGKHAMIQAQERANAEACHAAVHAGLREGTEAYEQCVGDGSTAYGPTLWPVVKAAQQNVKQADAGLSKHEHYDAESAAQLRAARKPFGDLPLIYLTRGVSPYMIPGKPQSDLNEAFEDEVLKSHDEIAQLSTRGVHYMVPGAGRDIQFDKPQAVIDAVLALVAAQR